MKSHPVATLKKASKSIWLALGGTLFLGWMALIVSCATSTTDRQVTPPPGSPPGATYVGSDQCAACHDAKTHAFEGATHARLMAQGDNALKAGCEACHGPASAHVAAGGGKGTIVNPKNSPEVCFQCHMDKRGQFRLSNSHPVMSGHLSCSDCHNVHSGDAIKGPAGVIGGKGVQTAAVNATCAKCHPTQNQPHAFEHPALREGCTFCHEPHGTVNPKMLKIRSVVLCLQCHSAPHQNATGSVGVGAAVIRTGTAPDYSFSGTGVIAGHNQGRLGQGACWTSGCHEAIHGSNTNSHLRR